MASTEVNGSFSIDFNSLKILATSPKYDMVYLCDYCLLISGDILTGIIEKIKKNFVLI